MNHAPQLVVNFVVIINNKTKEKCVEACAAAGFVAVGCLCAYYLAWRWAVAHDELTRPAGAAAGFFFTARTFFLFIKACMVTCLIISTLVRVRFIDDAALYHLPILQFVAFVEFYSVSTNLFWLRIFTACTYNNKLFKKNCNLRIH